MTRNKPSLKKGQDPRDLPTYTIAEAAKFLGISQRTASDWYKKDSKILCSSGRFGAVTLLSFNDLSEAYILTLLTKFYHYKWKELRSIVQNARKETKLKRPLIEADLLMLFRSLILEKPATPGRLREAVDLAHNRNLVFPEFVDQLGIRIIRDRKKAPCRLYPWRLMEANDNSRPVSMEPDVLSGRLVVTGTRIPVSVLLGKRLAGRSVEDIAAGYQLDPEVVRKALLHIDRPIHSKTA